MLLQHPTQGSGSGVLVARLLNGWPRVAAVAARAVCPWLQARWVFIEAKVRPRIPPHCSMQPCARALKHVPAGCRFVAVISRWGCMCGSTIRAVLILWCFVVQLTQRSAVLASIHASVGSGCKAMLAGSVAGSFPSLFVSSGKMCNVTPLSAQLHILLFHLVGAYFLLSNRILGIRYVFVFLLIFLIVLHDACCRSSLFSSRYVKRTPRHLSFPLFPLRIVGVLQVSSRDTRRCFLTASRNLRETQILRMIIIASKQLARAFAQRRASSSRVNIQVCGTLVLFHTKQSPATSSQKEFRV